MTIIIVDTNAIGYAAHNTRVLTNGEMETQAIFGTLKTLKHLREKFHEGKMLCLWDEKANWRYDLLPSYKAQRDEDPEKAESRKRYKAQTPYIKRGIEFLGIPQMVCEGYEADDLAGMLCRQAKKRGEDVLLITGDGDWMQLIDATTKWYDPRTNRQILCDHKNFHEITGFKTATQFLQAKAIIGDKSDNIDGIPKLGEKAATNIVKQFGGVPGLYKAWSVNSELVKEDFIPELQRQRKAVNELCSSHMKLFKRNIQLMNLRDPRNDVEMIKSKVIRPGRQDWEEFSNYCGELGFVSIHAGIAKWKRTFA